ncbi:MAG: polyketide synthase, partial [Rhodobacteraceae bacterium]|nr:polyketide synthase [Paracoccaceae bacterium]
MSNLEDIAIVGMSGLFPKAPDIDVFWSNILNKVDAVTDSPEGWLGNGDIFDPTSDHISKIYTRKGGFLGDLGRFDARAFGTMPLSIEGSQPDQFLALKLAHDALVDAGMTPGQFDGTKTGVILGMAVHAHRANTNGIQQFWFEPQMREIFTQLFPGMEPERIEAALELFHGSVPKIAPDAVPGLIPNILTGRIANRLDLMGPNYIIDAACASTLITIDLAMNELRSGNADVMLAGGINTTTSPLVYAVFCSVDALSRDGLIRPFGQESSGTVLGEGAGIVVLKRLSDALDNGDRIHAVVKGSGQ